MCSSKYLAVNMVIGNIDSQDIATQFFCCNRLRNVPKKRTVFCV